LNLGEFAALLASVPFSNSDPTTNILYAPAPAESLKPAVSKLAAP
jgi:hypothetical protein